MVNYITTWRSSEWSALATVSFYFELLAMNFHGPSSKTAGGSTSPRLLSLINIASRIIFCDVLANKCEASLNRSVDFDQPLAIGIIGAQATHGAGGIHHDLKTNRILHWSPQTSTVHHLTVYFDDVAQRTCLSVGSLIVGSFIGRIYYIYLHTFDIMHILYHIFKYILVCIIIYVMSRNVMYTM